MVRLQLHVESQAVCCHETAQDWSCQDGGFAAYSRDPTYITMEDPDGNPIMFDEHDPGHKHDPKTID